MKKDYINICVSSNDLGKRIDVVISKKIISLSRNRIKSLIIEKNVSFNDELITEQAHKLKDIGIIIISIPEPKKSYIKPEKIELDILYEDKYLIVLDKKPGIVVHPGAGNKNNTIVNGLLYHCKDRLSDIGGVLRPGIVHRIDKMTSGVLVIAKNNEIHKELSDQFKNRTISKKYICLCWNGMPKNNGTINENIARSKYNRKKMSVCNQYDGKKAITDYKLLDKFILDLNLSINFYECKLHTGRTHQIRVHFDYMGCPLIGDDLYKKKINLKNIDTEIFEIINKNFIISKRQALHAKSIDFFHPKKREIISFESRIPDDFLGLLNILKKNNSQEH